MVKSAEIIGERLDATVVNMRFVKPLDEELVLRLAATHTRAGHHRRECRRGRRRLRGASNCSRTARQSLPTLTLGIPDRFIEHGSREDCLAAAELDQAEPRPLPSSAGGSTADRAARGALRDIKRRNRPASRNNCRAFSHLRG